MILRYWQGRDEVVGLVEGDAGPAILHRDGSLEPCLEHPEKAFYPMPAGELAPGVVDDFRSAFERLGPGWDWLV